MPDSRWSAEARVLFDPAGVFRDSARDARARVTWWRRPLALLFALGCFVSILASGRFTVRLILDGAVSFAFVVAVEIAAFAIVSRVRMGRASAGRAPAPFARNVDLFFVGNAPWLLWMVVVGLVFGVVPPRDLAPWIEPAIFGSVIPAVWSGWIDFHFFREVLQHTPRRAGRTLLLNRGIGWVLALGIFFGIAFWSLYGPRIAAWVGM